MSEQPVETIHYADTNAVLAEISSKRPSDLTRHIEVIGAGFSRTATVSFTLALQILLKGPATSHAQILPAICFQGELAEAYPNAKVIVTTRDPEKWWVSFSELLKTVMPWWVQYIFWSMPTLRWYGKWADGMSKRQHVIYPPGTELNGPQFLLAHHEYIKSVVPPERLFFFNVKDGWEPLCKILNVPIPDEPFPHANDKLAVQQAFMGLIKEAAMRWIEILIVPALVVGAYFFMTR
ncbi:hypothetical protein EG329_006173 [Mollisiaceae sp. DMI_Dod_QoI]|nr:hypothetical protein EG329_006173 [Helotiales sp. DMI_Dod_QoI]